MGLLDGILGAVTSPEAALVGAGLSFLGTDSTNQTNADIAQQNSAFNAEQAQANRDFQAQQQVYAQGFAQKEQNNAMDYGAMMAGTGYQRTVADMKAAGLNPMLAYSQGAEGGASVGTPGAGMASGSQAYAVQPAAMQNPMASAAGAITQIQSLASKQAEIDNINADTENKKAQLGSYKVQSEGAQGRYDAEMGKLMQEVHKIANDAYLTTEQTNKVIEETRNAVKEGRRIDANTDNVKVNTELSRLDIPGRQNQAAFELKYPWNKTADYFNNQTGKIVNSAARAASAFKPFQVE